MSDKEILVKCESVSKKFCLDFKQSLIYGLKDVLSSGSKTKSHKDKLRKNEFWAVKNISFELQRGECVGLIGQNGAGKSTLLKMLNGLINPDQGKITMRGRIGALIELGAGFNPILTGRENIYNNGAVLGFTKEEIDNKFDQIVEFSEIGDFIDSPVQNYSSGMKVRLGFAVAAQMEPDILLIDEVLAVGDLGFRIKCLNRIAEMLKSTAVIFVSHSMPAIGKICNSSILLNKGELIMNSKNVAFVIQSYFSIFSNKENYVTGNGKAILIDVDTKGSDHNNGIIISNYRDNITINIKYKIDRTIEKYAIYISFFNLELRSVALISSLEENRILLNNNSINSYQIKFKNYLAEGKYSIAIEFIEITNCQTRNLQAGEYLLTVRNAAEFLSIGSNLSTYCPVLLKSSWQIEKG